MENEGKSGSCMRKIDIKNEQKHQKSDLIRLQCWISSLKIDENKQTEKFHHTRNHAANIATKNVF